jgi:diaminopropionate ammonia-lyase
MTALAPTPGEQVGAEVFVNPRAMPSVPGVAPGSEPLQFHRRLPGYAPSPLVRCPDIAERLGVGEVWVKDESWRLGLPAFKMLGASYAVYRALIERLGHPVEWDNVSQLKVQIGALEPLTLAAATDGNHGRAVARMARLLGLDAAIYVPEGTTLARLRAIESEGATVTVVDGDYDAAVRRSAEDANSRCLVISDTSWQGYRTVPAWVIDGYSTIFAELTEQLAAAGAGQPTAVVIPVGVGALASAAVRHFKPETGTGPTPVLVGVEPASANCVLESLRAGHLVTVPGPHPSIMVGLNCGTPSEVGWPYVSRGIDGVVAIDDEWARTAVRDLAAAGITAGETGAAALAGLTALCSMTATQDARTALGVNASSSVLVLATEGATDPESWERIVGRPVPEHSPIGLTTSRPARDCDDRPTQHANSNRRLR